MDLPNEQFAQQVDAFLQDKMPREERQAFVEVLRDHPELAAFVAQQEAIDQSLRAAFKPTKPTIEEIGSRLPIDTTETSQVSSRTRQIRRTRLWLVSLAASAACLVFGWFVWESPPRLEPYFEPQALTTLYRQAVAEGFKPYYECFDLDRFTRTIRQRQGTALRLAKMPAGSGMLGMSYPGGLSRNTTAVLFRVDGQPVMVFVDRIERDQPIAQSSDDSTLRVFRHETADLVLYEVTPLPAPRAIPFLSP